MTANDDAITYTHILCERVSKLESYLIKNKFADDRIKTDNGSIERFRVSPQAMRQAAINYCNRERIMYCEIADPIPEAAQ